MERVLAHEREEVPERLGQPVAEDDEVVRGLHDLRRALSAVAELARGQPRVAAHRDPDGVDPVAPERAVRDPLADDDGDHDRQHVRERARQLEHDYDERDCQEASVVGRRMGGGRTGHACHAAQHRGGADDGVEAW